MIIDFHTHGKLSKGLPFSSSYTDWLLEQARNSGLDAICLTEHFNTLQFEALYQYIASICEIDGDTFLHSNGLKIFSGIEVDVAERGHVLVIGRFEAISEIHSKLLPFWEKEDFIAFDELVDLIKPFGVVFGGAHPYRSGGRLPVLTHEQLSQFDFFDLNGKDVALNRQFTEEKTYALGKKLKRAVICGSDTHQAFQFGSVFTHLSGSPNTVEALKLTIEKGAYENILDPDAAFKVKAATLLKVALKEIHALGGDYISVLRNS